MGYFQTKRGRLSVGLLVLSAGGLLISQMFEHVTTNRQATAVHLALVFWTIFGLKMIYEFAWVKKEKETTVEELSESKLAEGTKAQVTTRRRRAARD